jgi:hypothetical protein
MSKDQAAWLVLRTIGLIILLAGLFHLYHFMMNLLAVLTIPGELTSDGRTLRHVNLRWDPFLHFIALSAFSIYFLRYGRVLHRWLLREDR